MRIEHIGEVRSFTQSDIAVARAPNELESMKIRMREHGEQKEDVAPWQVRNALLDALDAAKERLEGSGLNIRLKVADKIERLQVEVFDPRTKEVLRRFPPDEIIRLAESIDEMAGLIVNKSL